MENEITKLFKLGSRNISSLNNRDQKIIMELYFDNRYNLRSRSKKKGERLNTRTTSLIYNAGVRHKRATAEVGLVLNEKYETNIVNIHNVNEHLLHKEVNFNAQSCRLLVYAQISKADLLFIISGPTSLD